YTVSTIHAIAGRRCSDTINTCAGSTFTIHPVFTIAFSTYAITGTADAIYTIGTTAGTIHSIASAAGTISAVKRAGAISAVHTITVNTCIAAAVNSIAGTGNA